jgi:hypothetical protein
MSIRRRIKGPLVNAFIIGLSVSLLFIAVYLEVSSYGGNSVKPNPNNLGGGNYTNNAFVTVDNVEYGFDYQKVSTVRPDIFKPHHFSMFDILVHLSEHGKIDLEYHWNESMNTHVVDSINNKANWWYEVVYSGGWRENNVFRMDLYPWKLDTHVDFYQTNSDYIKRVYKTFREEVERRDANNGYIIIPEVTIDSPTESFIFRDINVTAHNLRNDTLQIGVITALDVIMSMGDQGLITYSLTWYDSIGTAEVVRSYWVSMLVGKAAVGTCGWVYESGSDDFYGFAGNHIHLPSDVRVLNSPEYNLWFWICL